jgi:Tfp pilus assembly protein PilX
VNVINRKRTGGTERGVALIIALLVLLLITAVGMGMIIMANTETSVSANFRDEQTAYFAAKAGIEEVRDRMRSGATNSLNTNVLFTTIPAPMAGGLNGVLYVTNPNGSETVAPWNLTGSNYPDNQISKELNCAGTAPTGSWYISTPVPASASYAASPQLSWKWVRVMAKINKSDTGCTQVTSVDGTTNGNLVCWNGANETTTIAPSCGAANNNWFPVYELTALAVTPSGSRRMMQYEVSQNSFPVVPGAFVFDGSNPSFNPPNSSAFAVSGTDPVHVPNSINGQTCPVPVNQPALGAYDDNSVTTLNNDITKRPTQYSTSTPAVAVMNVNPTLSSDSINLTTVDGLTKLSAEIVTAAGPNVYPNGVTPTNMGTTSNPVINVVNGDLTVSGSGAGILLVTGTLTLHGGFTWNGLILAIGEGAIVKDGGGSATMEGAVFAGNLYSDNPGANPPGPYPAYSNPIPLGATPPNPPGIPFFGWNGGGSATVQYDSCWILAVTQSLPYHLVSQRELSY